MIDFAITEKIYRLKRAKKEVKIEKEGEESEWGDQTVVVYKKRYEKDLGLETNLQVSS